MSRSESLFECRIRRGWFFWQGEWTDYRHGKIGIGNDHIYRAFTRRGIIARMHRVRERHTRTDDWQVIAG